MCFKEPNMQRLNYSAFNVQKQAKFPRDVEELCQLMQSRCRSCMLLLCPCHFCWDYSSPGAFHPAGCGCCPRTHPCSIKHHPCACVTNRGGSKSPGRGGKGPDSRVCADGRARAACPQRCSTASAALLYASAPEQSSPCNH